MQQSSVIFANLIIAYLLFITMKGELPAYIDLLRGGGQEGGTGSSTGAGAANAIVSGAQSLLNDNPFDFGSSAVNSFNSGNDSSPDVFSL